MRHVDQMPARIRLAQPADAEQMLAIYTPIVRDTIISFELEPPGSEEFQRRIEHGMQRFPWLVCDREGELLGYAYAGAYRARPAYQWCCESSVYVAESARGCGVGRALYTSLFKVLELQGYCGVYAGTTLPNPASVALHRACGFSEVGVFRQAGYKHGAWHDVAWWQLRLQDPPSPPDAPAALLAISDTDQLARAAASGLVHLNG